LSLEYKRDKTKAAQFNPRNKGRRQPPRKKKEKEKL